MGIKKLVGAVLVGGLLVAGAPGTAAEAAAKPKVLKVTPALKTKLKAIYKKKTASKYKKLRIKDTHYGRIGTRYWALTCLYYADSPVLETDCGATFTKKGKKGAWKLKDVEGGFECTSIPLSLIHAWKLSAQHC